MDRKMSSTLYEKLNAELPGLKDIADALSRTLQRGDKKESRKAIKSVEAQGYFFARESPLNIFGRLVSEDDISARLIATGVNGHAKYDVRLEHTYEPTEYTPQSLLNPDGKPIDNYHLRCAQDAIVEYCRRHLKLDLSFEDSRLVLARTAGFNASLPNEATQFRKDLTNAKAYLAEMAIKRADAA